ncbi:unnamed protein product [Prorocentrum cordatum]|uniref:Uncharacterized protein n=1 Tax=Prorocentrum cordatum TaxID=2364126 RepID=A0ABN9SII4_9DINO|nr:unnamed protein product [Polarella glacialis]
MLATVGYITPDITSMLPGHSSPSAALEVPAACWAQIVAYGAHRELFQDQTAGTLAAGSDFGSKVLTSSDVGDKRKTWAADIANCLSYAPPTLRQMGHGLWRLV